MYENQTFNYFALHTHIRNLIGLNMSCLISGHCVERNGGDLK